MLRCEEKRLGKEREMVREDEGVKKVGRGTQKRKCVLIGGRSQDNIREVCRKKQDADM